MLVKSRRFLSSSPGFTLSELVATLGIITFAFFFVGAILFPIFAKGHNHSNRGSCASNIKQINLAFMQYAQDYDEKLPLAAIRTFDSNSNILFGWAVRHTTQGEALEIPADTGYGGAKSSDPSFGGNYLKNEQILICPTMPRHSGSSYMMNDLASGADLNKITGGFHTVLLCDGEDFAGNVGHSYAPNDSPAPATYSPTGRVILGATMQSAPTRHSGGATYGFADGHVKWLLPQTVFFPPRWSSQRSHRDPETNIRLGPNPGDDMAANGHVYSATFHLN